MAQALPQAPHSEELLDRSAHSHQIVSGPGGGAGQAVRPWGQISPPSETIVPYTQAEPLVQGCSQTPPAQVEPVAQALPQLPQLSPSLLKSVQIPLAFPEPGQSVRLS